MVHAGGRSGAIGAAAEHAAHGVSAVCQLVAEDVLRLECPFHRLSERYSLLVAGDGVVDTRHNTLGLHFRSREYLHSFRRT